MRIRAMTQTPVIVSLATPLSAQTLAQASMLVNIYQTLQVLEVDPVTRPMRVISSPARLSYLMERATVQNPALIYHMIQQYILAAVLK
jgi:hypothetical protein